MTRDEVAARFGLSGAVMDRLDAYVALVRERQDRMNLVGPATLPDIWHRHVADSVQLARLAPAGSLWLDIGAGGGFPGVVLGIVEGPDRVVLVESIAKKCAFLRDAVDATGARCTVVNARAETMPREDADVITARAVAALPTLFALGAPHARRDTTWVLPKGAKHEDEVDAARQEFEFVCEMVPSVTDDMARVIVARDVRRRDTRGAGHDRPRRGHG